MSCLSPLQAAVYAALSGDASLTAVAEVYDEPPATECYPYIAIGDFTELPAHTHDKEGWEVTMTIHAWDDRKGMKRLQQVLARMDVVLLHKVLTVVGWSVSSPTREFTETLREPIDDIYLRHLVTRWRIRALEAA